MGNTLKDDMAADAADVLLNTDEWAEEVTFWPGDGGSQRTITVRIRHNRRENDRDVITYGEDSITVTALRDTTHSKGGIDTPYKRGRNADRIVREGDSLEEAYVYTGEIISSTPHSWRLRYTRMVGLRTGTEQVQR